MRSLVGVDLGGSHVRAGLFAEGDPVPKAQTRINTQAQDGPQAVLARVLDLVRTVVPQGIQGMKVGIGAPGPLDSVSGVVLNAPNLPGWVDFPLRSLVEQALQVPVAIGNDANLAALAEWKFGAGRGTQDMIYITVSTGVGGGVISRGRLISGSRGLGAELGHMVANPHGPVCSCGRPGHLEAIASGPAIVRRATDLLHQGNASTLRLEIESDPELTPEVIAQAARQGDGLARQVIREAGEALGRQLAGLVHVFNPQVIVVGGGVAQIGEALFAALQTALQASIMHPAFLDGLEIRPAALGDDSGLVGAMILASEA